MAPDSTLSDSSAVRWRTLVATAEAALDGVIICAVGEPFPVVYMSRRAVALLAGDQDRDRGDSAPSPLTLHTLFPAAAPEFLTQLSSLAGQSQTGVHSIAARRPRVPAASGGGRGSHGREPSR